MLYYLYNDYRESKLFDINAKLRSESVLCKKIKLTGITKFYLSKINKTDLLIITESSIPSSKHYFKINNIKTYEKLLMKFDKKMILFEDMHDGTFINKKKDSLYSGLFRDLIKYDIKYGVSMYSCDEWDYITKNYNWNKTFILNHHYDSNNFYNMKLKKEIDILFYGDLNNIYPLRLKIVEILKDMKDMKDLTIKIVKRPGYFTNDMNFIKKHRLELAELINKSHICIATTSIYNYFVCKYLEIAACNCVVAGNMESIGKSIFQDNYIDLNLTMTDSKIKEKLINALKNKTLLKEMNKNVSKNILNFTIKTNYWNNLKHLILKI